MTDEIFRDTENASWLGHYERTVALLAFGTNNGANQVNLGSRRCDTTTLLST